MKFQECINMRSNELLAKTLEHASSIILSTKLTSGHLEQGTDMTSEALWRAVFEMIRHVGNRKARVLEQLGCSNKARHGQVLLGSWQCSPKEPAHQGAW